MEDDALGRGIGWNEAFRTGISKDSGAVSGPCDEGRDYGLHQAGHVWKDRLGAIGKA